MKMRQRQSTDHQCGKRNCWDKCVFAVVVILCIIGPLCCIDGLEFEDCIDLQDEKDYKNEQLRMILSQRSVRGGTSNLNNESIMNRSPTQQHEWEKQLFIQRKNTKKRRKKKQSTNQSIHEPKRRPVHGYNDMDSNNYDRNSEKLESKRKQSSAPEKQQSSSQNPNHKKDVEARPVQVNLPKYGKVVGRRHVSVDIFRGLPYAAPPVGALRFAPPEPVAPWAPSKLDASRDGPDCWQLEDPVLNPTVSADRMSEDCLYLNVYTPAGHAARSSKKLPVMVWFHGGAFQQGGASRNEYDGRRLAERDIIVVTLNYRLGALGFLVSSSDGLFGNFGLMDQRAALDWVQDNIKHFGGDAENITLFGESAGAVMIGLHLMMSKNDDGHKHKKLFHKAIMQSNPLGYRFRSVVIADFIGEALKRAVDCRDLACLRDERVEEIMRAQKSLMGVPRSVGDFFTWSPTLTKETKIKLSLPQTSLPSNEIGGRYFFTKSEEHRLPTRLDTTTNPYFKQNYISDWRLSDGMSLLDDRTRSGDSTRWSAVNVSQPLESLDTIPDDIPIMIGTNKHEGEMFVYTAFPAPMPKAVYWMFVGALFRDSASRVLQHYRGLVEKVEAQAERLAIKQLEEEENKQYYLENRKQLDSEYEMLLRINATNSLTGTSSSSPLTGKDYSGNPRYNHKHGNGDKRDNDNSLQAIVNTWSTGGYQSKYNHITEGQEMNPMFFDMMDQKSKGNEKNNNNDQHQQNVGGENIIRESNEEQERKSMTWRERLEQFSRQREEKRIARAKARALKEAAKVAVDYRPVMSAIINDYLFRCPSWHFAEQLSELRERQSSKNNEKKHDQNVYVYRFGQPTHIPGYKECWGKACHTAEIPYVFQSMDVLRSNYSTYGPHAQQEAPSAPEYPYSEIMAAYRGAFHHANSSSQSDDNNDGYYSRTTNSQDDRANAKKESTEGKKSWWGKGESKQKSKSSTSGASSSSSGHSTRFQNILKHFFGDYFIEDADEELASDMADRWSSFAKEANPNYDGSRAEWNPWRYHQSEYKELLEQNDSNNDDIIPSPYPQQTKDWDNHPDFISKSDDSVMNDFGEDYFWTEYDDEDFSDLDDPSLVDKSYIDLDDEYISDESTSSKAADMAAKDYYYRQRALAALKMEVVEEDIFRTELRRSKSNLRSDKKETRSSSLLDTMFLKQKLLFRSTLANEEQEQNQQTLSKRAAKDAIRYAQYLGLLGAGLTSDQDDDFNFPELLDLSWPPEGRLLERDCTCDMWDRIRCKSA